MRADAHTGSVIHSARTVGGGAGSHVTAAPPVAVAHVPSTQNRTVHTLPRRKAVGDHDGAASEVFVMADTCGA